MTAAEQEVRSVEVSSFLARLFDLRWVLGRYGDDPCDEVDIDLILGLPDGLTYRDGCIQFECNACEKWTEWHGEVTDFENGHYANVCGGSPRCCP